MEKFEKLLFLTILFLHTKTSTCSHVENITSNLTSVDGVVSPQTNTTAFGLTNTVSSPVTQLNTETDSATVPVKKNTTEALYVGHDSTSTTENTSLSKMTTLSSLTLADFENTTTKKRAVSNLPTHINTDSSTSTDHDNTTKKRELAVSDLPTYVTTLSSASTGVNNTTTEKRAVSIIPTYVTPTSADIDNTTTKKREPPPAVSDLPTYVTTDSSTSTDNNNTTTKKRAVSDLPTYVTTDSSTSTDIGNTTTKKRAVSNLPTHVTTDSLTSTDNQNTTTTKRESVVSDPPTYVTSTSADIDNTTTKKRAVSNLPTYVTTDSSTSADNNNTTTKKRESAVSNLPTYVTTDSSTSTDHHNTTTKKRESAVSNLPTYVTSTSADIDNTTTKKREKADSNLYTYVTTDSSTSTDHHNTTTKKRQSAVSDLPNYVTTASLFFTSPFLSHESYLMNYAPNSTTSPPKGTLDEAKTAETRAPQDLAKRENPMYHMTVDENCTKTYFRSDKISPMTDCSAANLSPPYPSLESQSFQSLSLTTEDMRPCSSDSPNIGSAGAKNILNGSITFSSGDKLFQKRNTNPRKKSFCVFLRTPPSAIIQVGVERVEEWMTNGKNTRTVFLSFRFQERKSLQALVHGRVLQSSKQEAVMIVEGLRKKFQGDVHPRTLTLTLQAVPWCRKEQLQVKCLRDNKEGLVQTPHWNKRSKYNPHMDSCVTLTAPLGYGHIMISFVQVEIEKKKACKRDVLEIYLTPGCSGDPESQICHPTQTLPKAHHTSVLSLRFKSDFAVEQAGFRLLYSFHREGEKPMQMWNGRWMCSGKNGDVLVRHFLCGPQILCANEEDRISGCPPAELCGEDSFQVEGKCYRTVTPMRKLTWTEARRSCRRNKGYLVTLNTELEWRKVVEFWVSFSNKEYLIIGLRQVTHDQHLPDLYSSTFQWQDSRVAYYLNLSNSTLGYPPYCAGFQRKERHLTQINCFLHLRASYICEVTPPPPPPKRPNHQPKISLLPPLREASNLAGMSACQNEGSTQVFLQCERNNHCYGATQEEKEECLLENPQVSQTMFACRTRDQHVQYSLVCDHRRDCSDRSDEDFCIFPPCPKDRFLCRKSKECLPLDQICDGVYHCVDRSDEESCKMKRKINEGNTVPPPAIINFSSGGSFTVDAVNISQGNPLCPETHFQCPGDGYCLPVYVRCNQVLDCPGGEDEADCESYTCPGFYRCHNARNCLHYDHVCDGQFQCPRHDDELMCNFTCPDGCQCLGYAFICQQTVQASLYPQLRYLNADKTGMTLQDVANNNLLIFLRLRECNIKNIGSVNLPNVHTLDLAYNQLHYIKYEEIMSMKNLRYLSLAFNKQLSLHSIQFLNMTFPNLHTLDMSGGDTYEITNTSFFPFPHIQYLNLSRSKLQKVLDPGFRILHSLRVLDISDCPLTEFDKDMFKGLSRIRIIYAPKFKICCPTVMPHDFNPNHCFAPADEVSSCEALLRADTFRVFLVMYALFALMGNFVSFMYRVFFKERTKKLGFDIFVTHLCVADFLMGVYLAIVGIADRIYYGTYEWNDLQWKQSVACQTAGFLSLVSSEVSAFLICFITLERFLLIRFPHKNIRFSPKSALIACTTGWIIGFLLAAIPLLPFSPPWDFYGQTGICIPLPITRKVFPGSEYSFYVMIVFNFGLFLLIAAGQFLIFWSIRSQRKMVGGSSKKAKDMAIARRLLAVVMSDFLCWFPIGLLGLLAKSGVPISGDVNVAMAIFILPFNSALNPFLYTFHMLVEQHRNARAQSQAKKTSKIMSKNCPSCHRCSQDLSVDTASGVKHKLPDCTVVTKGTDQETLIFIETFLKEHLMTPKYVHLRDQVINMIRKRNS